MTHEYQVAVAVFQAIVLLLPQKTFCQYESSEEFSLVLLLKTLAASKCGRLQNQSDQESCWVFLVSGGLAFEHTDRRAIKPSSKKP